MVNNEEVYEAVEEEVFREAIKEVLGEAAMMGENQGMKRLFEETVNQIMKSERDIYLKDNPGNKGNGYYPRRLSEGSFCLDLNVPRDRQGNFRPYILHSPIKGWVHLIQTFFIH